MDGQAKVVSGKRNNRYKDTEAQAELQNASDMVLLEPKVQ